ncbi:tetratricopeptide repeat protein [Treponema putidum]|uniref:tetratricopeptide repeat protein n=1 Tax=Treponema putidum TaxID=221027 RepID=UPI000A451612|nr:tetratricopeptide repeat protein [Treponema putidum]
MAVSIVDQGKKLLSKKKYNEVISTLEPHILDYRDSFAFHFYLGLSYLYAGDIQSAMTYLTRAKKIKPNDPDLLSTYAAMALRRSLTAEAVEYYLQALEHNPNCKIAKKGLDIIRKNNSPEKIGNLVQSGKIKTLYPSPGREEKKERLLQSLLF